jgi:hypothetical protein
MPDCHRFDSETIRRRTAIVMPQWFPPDLDAGRVSKIMAANLADVDLYAEPSRVCLVVDACPAAQEAIEELNARRVTSGLVPYIVVCNAENLGQGASLVRGFEELIGRGCPSDWYITRDADGDHFINDLPHLARMADQIAALTDGCYMVIGRRVNLRRSLTWLRGELEEWINSVLMACLAYRLARRGQVIDQRFMHPDAPWPDVQSGYKLYSLELVKHVIREYQGLSEPPWEPDDRRFLGQIVPFWLCLERGGICGEVVRSSLVAPADSSFGPETFRRQYRAKLKYVLARSELPGDAAGRIVANCIRRSGVWMHPDGRALCEAVFAELGLPTDPVWRLSY